MKEYLRERLPPSLKLSIKRLVIGLMTTPIRLSAHLAGLANRLRSEVVTYGLDLPHPWGVHTTPNASFVQHYGAADLLLVMDTIAGRKDRMPAPDRPIRTSIILLCYNKIELTFQCLRSLLREVDFNDTEIIVVNNGSTDETKQVLSHFDGYLRLVNIDKNIGCFAGNNQGARHARGKYLIFLNNDTLALPGWLGPLVETAEKDAGVGAIGSMLIYPDGRLQEAGGIVWKTGEVHYYGRGESTEDRRFTFAREVDFCSSASLLVRKDCFDQLGGFDESYLPISYSDVDISFGVRLLGYKVVYQPLSRIIHFGSPTAAGSDTQTNLEGDELITSPKFYEKWSNVLEREHLLPVSGNTEPAANRKWATQVAVFDNLIPTPDRDAGSARMMFILRALSEWAHPVFITTGKRFRPEYEKFLWREGIETASALDFKRLLKRRKFCAAVLSRPTVAAALLGPVRRADPKLKIIYDMLDVHHLRSEREAALTGAARAAREAKTLRRLETRLARAADLLWCGSSPDQELMARLAPNVPSVVVPTVHSLHGRGRRFRERHDLLFVGNFRHRPNEDAVHFLAREVLPLIRKTLPEIELLVVGVDAPPEFAGYAAGGVRLLGYVPDLEPIMFGCRVFVAPIRFGSGVNGKIGEALSYGLPVVTTTIGAEGWGFTDGDQVLIADTPDDFAGSVLHLYEDAGLWQKLADCGYAHITKNYTPEVVGRVINDSVRAAARFKEPRRLSATDR